VNERTSGNVAWHLSDGGRIHLSKTGSQFTLTKVGPTGALTTTSIESADEIGDAELRTDDAGSYWLVDRARRSVVGFFAASDGMHVGAMPDPALPIGREGGLPRGLNGICGRRRSSMDRPGSARTGFTVRARQGKIDFVGEWTRP